jgi:DNA modification methylase
MGSPYRLLVGDVLVMLRDLPDESVNCVVTSPPYWGLRDYGVKGQIGLEKTPQEFISKLVSVFREVRRVLRRDGTCWVNMGDSYSAQPNQRVQKGEGRDDVAGWKQATNNGSCGVGSRSVPGLKAKDLVGMPWRLAFALQDDGWWLRQDIIWSKPNPMPESVTDRCTKAHEYLFLLTKSAKYYYDADAIKEPCGGWNGSEFQDGKNLITHPNVGKKRKTKMPDGWDTGTGGHGSFHRNGREKGETREVGEHLAASDAELDRGTATARFGRGAGWRDDPANSPETRNKRSVWTISTQPFNEAHFATFPMKLVEPCIRAGCPAGGVVLDLFNGSGTTGLVALAERCSYIGIELNPEYAAMAERRLAAAAAQGILAL